MTFETVQIAPQVYHLQSGANTGLIVVGRDAILIDAGLDDDTGRRIRKAADALAVRITTLIVTHAHADHFGGASYLRRNLPPFAVGAPKLEAAIIANPQLEGISLSAGAVAFNPLNDKFTNAPPIEVDTMLDPGTVIPHGDFSVGIVALPGHSPQQIGVRVRADKGDAVLFCADAFLPLVTLQKYPIPFTAHIEQALQTLANLQAEVTAGVILAPGHGLHLRDTAARDVIAANEASLRRILEATESALHVQPLSEADVTFAVAGIVGDALATPVGYYLARATVQAALVWLYEQQRAIIETDGARRMLWHLI